jgi:hypothetical protein
MAISILTGVTVTLGGTSLSDHVESVEINQSYEDVEITAMGATAKTYAPGLREDEIVINFYQDYAAASVDQVIAPLLGSAAGAIMVIKPTSGTVSSVNPSYTCTVSPYEYSPISGSVGEANQTSVTFKPVAGSSIVRATT